MSERYRIREKIGQGGVGAVYRAYDTSLRREVAIKRLLTQDNEPGAERRSTESLIKEAGMLSKLQHPNIVTIYDIGIDDDGGYVVMELIDGETFDMTIARGALTADDFSQVVDQTLEALIAAQEIGMLHRDIKPSNVMVSWLPSGRFQVKVLDFGLAKLSQMPALQTVNHGDAIMGSIYFMAPEQFDREPLDARTDLYSLGCLYYYGLAGKYPFDGDSAAEVMVAHLEHEVVPLGLLRPDLHDSLCGWVMRLISKGMGERPATASEALREFGTALAAVRAAARATVADSSPARLPTSPPSPDRPQLITGPIGQLTAPRGMPLHTTGYQLPPQEARQPFGAVIVWSLVVLGGAAASWLVFKPAPDAAPTSPPPPQFAAGAGEKPATTAAAAIPAPKNPLASQALISRTSRWSYLDRGAAPADWFQPSCDISQWPQGKSPLGFGDPVETELAHGESAADARVTYYFRKSVKIGPTLPPDAKFSLEMRLLFDDGFRIYLNGDELLRHAMPEGEILPGTLATTKRQGKAEAEWEVFNFVPSILSPGSDNVFAIEVHQESKKSSDVRFAMMLSFIEK